jgi:hypothetical protein
MNCDRFERSAINALKRMLLRHPTGISSGASPHVVPASSPRAARVSGLQTLSDRGFSAVVDIMGARNGPEGNTKCHATETNPDVFVLQPEPL